jgi:hypothetical protein
MSMQSIESITPAYDFSPMSPTLKRLVELAVQARRDAAFLGLEPERPRPDRTAATQAGRGAEPSARTQDAPAPRETGRLDLRA